MTTQITVNQHYVPRFYLDNFANSQRFNWVFDKRHGSVRLKNNRSLCSSDHFYDLPATLGPDNVELLQIVERKLSQIEAIGERMIGAILKGAERLDLSHIQSPGSYERLNPFQIRNLSGFIALQYLRTEAAREMITRENYALAEDLVKSIAAEQGKSVDTAKFDLKVSENWIKWYHIDSMMKFPEFTEYFEKKIFVIGLNRTSTPLVTSDNPVAMCPHEYDDCPALNSKGMRLLFPLSPQVIICMYDPSIWGRRMEPWDGRPMLLSKEDVSNFNNMQMLSSRRQLYARERDDLNFAKCLSTRHPRLFAFDQGRKPVSTESQRLHLVKSLMGKL